jgi:enoyl-CoA hydratase
MVIPTPILELIKFRVSPSHKYRSILGAEMYPLEKAIDAGLMDQVVDSEKLMVAAMEKAKDLATMGHPSYTLTKALFIKDVAENIDNAIEELEIK